MNINRKTLYKLALQIPKAIYDNENRTNFKSKIICTLR